MNRATGPQTVPVADSIKQALAIPSDTQADAPGDDYRQYTILVVDTSDDYQVLDRRMYTYSHQLHIPVDTMNRSFNAKKNLIALAENDSDELYAGEYAPRRFPGESFSIEYLSLYFPGAPEKTMALVAGIYESTGSADTTFQRVKALQPHAFLLEASVFVGCIH